MYASIQDFDFSSHCQSVIPIPRHASFSQLCSCHVLTLSPVQTQMPNFDAADTTQSLSLPGGTMVPTNSLYSTSHEFHKTQPTCPDGLILTPAINNHIPPNVSFSSQSDFGIRNNTKLDSLIGTNGNGVMLPDSTFANHVTVTSTSGFSMFGPPLSNTNNATHSPLRAQSPAPFTLNLLSSQSVGGFANSGSAYLHPGLSQPPIGASSRASLST